MNELPPPPSDRFRLKKLFQYFLQGLLIIAPVAITIYAVYKIVDSIDSLLPIFTAKTPNGTIYIQNYGLGFLIIIFTICLIGYFSSFFIKLKLFSLFDSWMGKAPGIRFIYSTVKDFFEAFAGEKKKFNRPVLANIDDADVWRVGFITQDDVSNFGLPGFVAVYIPMAYSIAGNVYLLPRDRVRIIDVNATDAMKFAISGGVTNVVEEKHNTEQV
jgi:uncharacterized membrane protein